MPTRDEQRGATHSDLSGSAGDVVQARDVTGGIHFHGSGRESAPVPAQLPGDVRGFVNRTADLARLDAVLGDGVDQPGSASVCVIAGTAGVGKTSLAVRWAHRARHRFPDGQLYVNLRGYDPGEPVGPAQVLERFLTALGVPAAALPAEVEDRSALFRTLLVSRRVLIVLDNAATVGQVRPLLPGAGQCPVLVTSRSRLSGLTVRDGAHRVTLEVFDEPEAVALLKVAVNEYRSGDGENEIAELARLCARLPLALRIAAERAAARPRMPMSELIGDLRDESQLWDALSAETDDEADSVRAVFAWSYRALPVDAARAFRLLGLHPGPDFSTEAVAAIVAASPDMTRRMLDVLVGSHLLSQTEPDRYQFHDLLRAYARDRARYEEEEDARRGAIGRVCTWYLYSLINAVGADDTDLEHLVSLSRDDSAGAQQFDHRTTALAWIEAEYDNIVAMSRTASGEGMVDVAWKLPALLRVTYGERHSYGDWLPLGERALSALRDTSDAVGKIVILHGLSTTFRLRRRLDQAAEHGREALRLAAETGDPRLIAACNVLLGHVRLHQRKLTDAYDSYSRALATAPADDSTWTVTALGGQAEVHVERGELEQAKLRLDQAFERMPPGFPPMGRTGWLQCRARIEREAGQIDRAHATINECLSNSLSYKWPSVEAFVMIDLARIQRVQGKLNQAMATLRHAAAIHWQVGDPGRAAIVLDTAGEIYQELGDFEQAADLHRRAAMTHHELHDDWNQAIAEANLAAALEVLCENTEAVSHYRASLQLIEKYSDRQAQNLSRRISEGLARMTASDN